VCGTVWRWWWHSGGGGARGLRSCRVVVLLLSLSLFALPSPPTVTSRPTPRSYLVRWCTAYLLAVAAAVVVVVVSLLFFLCHCVASGMDTENTTVRRSARQISRPRTPLARVAPAVPALGSSGVVGSARGREQFASALAAAANRSLDAAKASLSLSPSKATVSRAVSDSTRTLPAPAPAIGAFVLSLTSNDVASRRCRCS